MTKRFNIRALGAAFTAASALVAAAPASAEADAGTVGVSVRYSDLDISQVAGAKVLLDRIRLAARYACGDETDIVFPEQRRGFDQCQAQAIHAAVAKMNSSVLSALAGAKIEPVHVVGR